MNTFIIESEMKVTEKQHVKLDLVYYFKKINEKQLT